MSGPCSTPGPGSSPVRRFNSACRGRGRRRLPDCRYDKHTSSLRRVPPFGRGLADSLRTESQISGASPRRVPAHVPLANGRFALFICYEGHPARVRQQHRAQRTPTCTVNMTTTPGSATPRAIGSTSRSPSSGRRAPPVPGRSTNSGCERLRGYVGPHDQARRDLSARRLFTAKNRVDARRQALRALGPAWWLLRADVLAAGFRAAPGGGRDVAGAPAATRLR
jgi:hypothetical protein